MDEEEIAWLQELHEALWPPDQQKKGGGQTRHGWVQIKLEAKRELTKAEWGRVKQAIIKHKLVVEMIGTNMFGGVGIRVYEHPRLPGDDHTHLLTVTQEHLPGPTRQDRLLDETVEEPDFRKPTGGNCSRLAHGMFWELSSTEENRRWLRDYGLMPPQDPIHYDY